MKHWIIVSVILVFVAWTAFCTWADEEVVKTGVVLSLEYVEMYESPIATLQGWGLGTRILNVYEELPSRATQAEFFRDVFDWGLLPPKEIRIKAEAVINDWVLSQ